MRCIFCKEPSASSKSIEHIVPESLGNKIHVLPAGIVCDSCNNYFARKIEGPLLNDEFFIQARFRGGIENKKGRIPVIKGILFPDAIELGLLRHRDGSKSLGPVREDQSNAWVQAALQRDRLTVITPLPEPPDSQLIARFLGKVGLEVLAARVRYLEGGLDEIVDKPELDELRLFVRRGESSFPWPFHNRQLYPEDFVFPPDSVSEAYEMLHEFTLLFTDSQELYFVLAIFGVEYVINMGGPELDGYIKWLEGNNGKSPLYP
ncbi:MAG: HNH endonuclease [bacterium]|nr:HNH endonuclease [bacterium]